MSKGTTEHVLSLGTTIFSFGNITGSDIIDNIRIDDGKDDGSVSQIWVGNHPAQGCEDPRHEWMFLKHFHALYTIIDTDDLCPEDPFWNNTPVFHGALDSYIMKHYPGSYPPGNELVIEEISALRTLLHLKNA